MAKPMNGVPQLLDEPFEVAQARDMLVRRGYAILPNGSVRAFQMQDQFDPGDPAIPADVRARRHQDAILGMAHRLGVALVNSGQVEFIIAPGKNGLPDAYTLKVVIVRPSTATKLPTHDAPAPDGENK